MQQQNYVLWGAVDMKVTVAVLDKHGNNAVSRTLDLLQSFDVRQPITLKTIK